MVWIHGGAFVGGSGSSRWYDGSRFAAHDEVIVVTFNYRLGSLGFLDLGQACPGSANCGLLDQLAALRWVQDNIAVFGGDPDQVTVFGESAGAMSIGLMLTMPLARGLFQRAILASGTGASTRSAEQARQVTADVLAAFGGTVDELLVAPVEQILAAQTAVTGGSDATGYMCFRPVVDGDIIPAPADEAIAAGQSADIPVLIGTNRDEMTMFFAFDPTIAALTPEQFDAEAAAQIGPARWARMAQHYHDHCPPGDAAAVMAAVSTDLVFRMPALQLADGQAAEGRQAPVWMYRLDWASPAMGGRLGAVHAIDIPFVWALTDVPGVELMTGDSPQRHVLAQAMHAAWVAFARTGDPSTPLLPDWPPYRLPTRTTMLFDAECRVVDDPNGDERRLWHEFV